jgi:hypothetical protein
MVYINVTAENRGGITETFDVTLYDDADPIETQTIVNLAGGGTQILNFTWDTTPVPIGEYTLNATAALVPGETDLSDKNFTVNVYVGLRDLAATNVSPYRNSIPLAFSGIDVYVTVKNNGEETDTFNVSLYQGSYLIGTQETALISGGSEILDFTWNTSVLSYGNYTLRASIIPIPFDTNTADKNYTTSAIITIPGDINGDGTVDIYDAILLSTAFNSFAGGPNWNPNADLNGDGVVDIYDAIILSSHFGKNMTYPNF